MNVDVLVTYLKRHISDDVFALLVANAVPLTGPTGLRRWVAERDVEAFARLYFPDEFFLDFAPVHQTFVADIQEIRRRAIAGEPGLRKARAIPRGHAKSTFFSRLLPLHGLLYGWSPFSVLVANNATAAKRLLRNVREICETNDAIREDFEFTPGTTWGDERIEFHDAAIVCFGRGSGAIRGVSKPGQRPSLVIADDLDDDQSVRSAVQLANDVEWLDKSLMSIGDQVGFTTSFIFIGTVIRKTSLLWHVLHSANFEKIIEQGVRRFSSHPELWDAWREWFVEQSKAGSKPGSPAEDEFYQEHKTEMLAGVEVLWDRPDAYYHMMLFRLSQGDKAFFSEIQNAPSEAGGTLGKIPYRKLPDNLAGWNLLGSLDPTTKGGKTNDLAAWVEAYFHPVRKEVIISFVNAKQRKYTETIEFVFKRLQQSAKAKRFDGLWVEGNSSGSIIAEAIQKRVDEASLGYSVVQVQNSAKKEDRIAILSEYAERGQLFVAEEIDEEFVNEWESWLTWKWDDALDAAATIVQQLKEAGVLELFYDTPAEAPAYAGVFG